MDPRTFDGMIRRLSGPLSRRSLVGGSLGASVLAAVGLNDDAALAKKRVRADACIPTGKKCPAPKPRGKKKKKLGCDQCCQGITVTVTNRKGRQVAKCACKPLDSVCSPDKSHQCCSGVCGEGRCQFAPCAALGTVCDVGPDCCSGFCGDNLCRAAFCEDLGEECSDNQGTECCSGGCDDNCCVLEDAVCDVNDEGQGFCCNGRPCTGGRCQP